ncbi:hypothetical protein Angca_004715 [Angiostrongylus cantonensis]|nr:hypothetical protein Angca_004715 [Angiostrongylus cantonensis]
MNISEVLRDESTSKDRSCSRKRVPTYTSSTKNQMFTSTPYAGFHPQMPTPLISSGIYSQYPLSYNGNESLGKLSSAFTSRSASFLCDSSSESDISKHLLPSQITSGRTPLTDSGFLSSSSSSRTPVVRNVVRGYKKTYCFVCKVDITKAGKRSQGPRRHLLQHHVRRPLFQCPHCSHSSFYDKFHVTSHMRRIHHDKSDQLINRAAEFDSEVDEWYERCFGNDKSNTKLGIRQNTTDSADQENITECKRKKNIRQITSQQCSTPPPVLTPEAPKQENSDNTVSLAPIVETPLKAPPKKRRIGFMIEDLLKPSPTRHRKYSMLRGRKLQMNKATETNKSKN